jgi:hypothetical protein
MVWVVTCVRILSRVARAYLKGLACVYWHTHKYIPCVRFIYVAGNFKKYKPSPYLLVFGRVHRSDAEAGHPFLKNILLLGRN